MNSSKELTFTAENAINKNFLTPILDVKLYQDNLSRDILIGFDLITSSSTSILNLPLRLNDNLNAIHLPPIKCPGDKNSEDRWFKNLFENSEINQKAFETTKPEQCSITADSSPWLYIKSSIIYRLPTNSHAALKWIGAFIYYLNKRTDQTFTILFNSYTQKNLDNFSKGLTSIPHNYDLNNKLENIHLILIDGIVALGNENKNDPYYHAIKELKKIYKQYCKDRENNINMPFVYYLQNDVCSLIINPIKYHDINSLAKKTRLFLKNDQKNKLKELLETHNEQVITRLYSSAIGKRALDNGVYSWRYTEFAFLIRTRFALTHDKKLCIISLDKNEGYLRCYAPGKKNEYMFENELTHLASVLKLKFDKENFIENGLVFDMESTAKLIDIGIICVDSLINEVKQSIYAENYWSLFNNSRIDSPDKGINILELKKDNLELIQHEMERARIASHY